MTYASYHYDNCVLIYYIPMKHKTTELYIIMTYFMTYSEYIPTVVCLAQAAHFFHLLDQFFDTPKQIPLVSQHHIILMIITRHEISSPARFIGQYCMSENVDASACERDCIVRGFTILLRIPY